MSGVAHQHFACVREMLLKLGTPVFHIVHLMRFCFMTPLRAMISTPEHRGVRFF